LCRRTKSPGYYSGVNGRDELYIKEINKNISTSPRRALGRGGGEGAGRRCSMDWPGHGIEAVIKQ